jgi:hypothetical protein
MEPPKKGKHSFRTLRPSADPAEVQRMAFLG